MSNTPRTEALLVALDMAPEPKVLIKHARELERELNAANKRIRQQELLDEENLRLRERIRRMEEAGDSVASTLKRSWNGAKRRTDTEANGAIVQWNKAKEAKP